MSGLDTLLWEAVNAGDIDAVKKNLESGALAEYAFVSCKYY